MFFFYFFVFRPNPGDHIAAYRDLTGAIFHHGIYVYDDYVIEMTDRGVGCKSYPDFKNGCWVYRVYDNQSLAPKIIVNRAVNALNLESKPYHLFKNNCEHFATKIATRFAQSKQAQAGMVYQHPPMGPDEYDDNLTHAPTQQNASMLTKSRRWTLP